MENSVHGSNDERARILRMVEDGALSATEAINLLDRLGKPGAPAYGAVPPAPPAPETDDVPDDDFAQAGLPPAPLPKANGAPTWLRVRVTDLPSGRNKVAVSIPFKLASWGLRMGARFDPKVEGIDLAELSRLVDEGAASGLLVDVIDEEDGEHVQVFVE